MEGDLKHSTQIQLMLERLKVGDETARAQLIDRAYDRLRKLAQRMFHKNPDLRYAVGTDDVLNRAAMRLHDSLREVQPPTVSGFFGLASVQIRRELQDLIRRHLGEHGKKAKKVIFVDPTSPGDNPVQGQTASGEDPSDLLEWAEFHDAVAALPNEECEVIHLLFYLGLKQAEAAELLHVSTRTIKRLLQSARQRLERDLPDL